jgi:hypothetical protein
LRFSVLKHDLFQADYVVIFSGLVKHQTISKKIEIRQYDSGTTKLLIFKNKETYFIFPQLPSFHIGKDFFKLFYFCIFIPAQR